VEILGLPFSVHITDLLLPVILIPIIRNKWYKIEYSLFVFGILLLLVVLSVILNNTYNYIPNFYPGYEFAKYACYFIFFKNTVPACRKLQNVWDAVFCFLVIFNFFHYFNLFDFNTTVMSWYHGTNNKNLIYFDTNSYGISISKRIIGVLQDPNYNAILFLFFVVMYVPYKELKKKNMLFCFFAFIGFILCQSRTAFIAFIVFWIVYCCLTSGFWKRKIIISLFLAMSFAFLSVDGDLSYLAPGWINTHHILSNKNDMEAEQEVINEINVFESNSWTYRLEMWNFFVRENQNVWTVMLGHSPNKHFIYSHQMYPHSQYVSIFYKYGLLGLFVLLFGLGLPFIQACRKIKTDEKSFRTGSFLGVIGICCITNCPLNFPVITLLVIYTLAQFYSTSPYLSFQRHVS
jgi:hypothetical protein